MLNRKYPIFLITDRKITLSDSVSRYVIDLAESFYSCGWKVSIYTSNESKISSYDLPKEIRVVNGLPNPNARAIFHFQSTYTIRKPTQFLLDNIEKLKRKSIVTLHVTPEYAKLMGQNEELAEILIALSKANILINVFSNYAKYDLRKYGIDNVWVTYPGLNLSRYINFMKYVRLKKKQILVVASNPESNFVKSVKGFDLLNDLKLKFKDFEIKKVINLPFDEYLKEMAQSSFYVALSKVEHYGFAIIDSYNLFTLPLYSNEGGLTEAVYGNGVPIFINGKDIKFPEKVLYSDSAVKDNFIFSQAEHNIEKHMKSLLNLYSYLA